MSLSPTEENYLKSIFELAERGEKSVSTNALSKRMKIAPASVTDMLKKLAEKDLTQYERYKGVRLTQEGKHIATILIRKHRLWETFLYEKMNFNWHEVHDIAEQLEHIQSAKLIQRLDTFLGYPKFDPHGDPIPDEKGNFTTRTQIPLIDLKLDQKAVIVGVREHSKSFLQYLDSLHLTLGTTFTVIDSFEYDNSLKIQLENGETLVVSSKVGHNLFVTVNNN